MRRFFINPEEINNHQGIITGEEAHHMLHVMRMKAGNKVELVDGTGNIFQAVITATSRNEVTVLISGVHQIKDQPPFLHLGVASLSGKKMELIVQKATELGIASIQPFTSRYNAGKEIGSNKEQRWQKISAESCKQCGRSIPPEISPQTTFDSLITDSDKFDLKIIFYEDENRLGLDSIENELRGKTPGNILYMVGPKGGFAEEEIMLAGQHGFLSIGLGPLVLRAETAAIAGGALLQYLLGKLVPASNQIPSTNTEKHV